MSGETIKAGQPLTDDEKRAALELVLHSNTFARADQLKSFLKYVCEAELAGKGCELTEYAIGIEALGRPPSYSPGYDSAVRNRAFALRKKLQEYYEHENPEAPLRIELTKGSYCPHYLEHQPAPKSDPDKEPQAIVMSAASRQQNDERALLFSHPYRKQLRNKMILAFIAGVFLTALIAGLVYFSDLNNKNSGPATTNLSAILIEAWGPILDIDSDVIISVANPPGFSVHASNDQPDTTAQTPSLPPNDNPGRRTMPPSLYDWFRMVYPKISERELYLTITSNATYWGDTLGSMLALKTIYASGGTPQIFPEKVITVPMLRRRQVVLFGAPEYSPVIRHFLEKCPLTIRYLQAITSQEPGKDSQDLYTTTLDERRRLVQVYGLITVLPSQSTTNNQHRTLIFSGINSAGTQAAAEFFTSPDNMQELKAELQKGGYQTFPPAYQVVVRAEIEDSILLHFKYETYRIINTPLSD